MTNVSVDVLRTLIQYEPDTGKLFWLQRPKGFFPNERICASWNTHYSGKEALAAKDRSWYLHGTLLKRSVLAHRVAWAWFHGEWPESEIDHIDCSRTNNKIENLRLATSAENKRNQRLGPKSTSGIKGVSINRRSGMWVGTICSNGRQVYVGRFASIEEAEYAVREARVTLHGQFARHA